MRLSVTGPAAPWSWVTPDTLSLGPGAEAVARVSFHVPRAPEPAAGPLPFEVAAVGAGGGAPATTVPGVLHVRPFTVLSAELAGPDGPARGGGPARHRLTVSNRGNAPAATALRAHADEGLTARVDPPEVVVAAGGTAAATVEVAPASRLLTGRPRSLGFGVVADPEHGVAVEVAGRFRQEPAVARPVAVATALVAVVALVAGLAVLRAGDPGTGTGGDPVAAGGAQLDDCPARGHTDTFGLRGLEPVDIEKLPESYAFLRVRSDGCTPMRFNPCQPVHYVQNVAAAPPGVADDVREAFRRLSQATGITFVDDGTTDETTRAGPYVPERYGARWAPILILWEHFPPELTSGPTQVLGNTGVYREQEVVVSGRLRFNVDARSDEQSRATIRAGFGPPAGSGEGPIGRANITWGRIVLHELAHLVGLGHTRDPRSLMYPDAAQQTGRPVDFAPPDFAGLRYLGREAGCLTPPPLPA